MPLVIAVLPAYNEEKAIGALLEEFKRVFEKEHIHYKLIVVNDGSSDKTGQIANGYSDILNIKVVNHPQNKGLGRTIITGFQEAVKVLESGDDVIVNMDADNTHSPDFIPSMLKKIQSGADLVIASRYQPGSEEIGVPFLRRLYSRGAKFLFKIFFNLKGINDYTCGFRAYRASLIIKGFEKYKNDLISRNGFACTDELLIHLATLTDKYEEVPFILRYDKKEGKSKLKLFTTILETFKLLFKGRAELIKAGKK